MNSFEGSTHFEQTPRQKKRIVVYLGGRMYPTNAAYEDGTKKWAFPLFIGNQANTGTPIPGEVSGGFSRQEAIRIVYEDAINRGENIIILTTGDSEETGESRSTEAVERLVRSEGINEKDVASIGGRGSTIGNAEATLGYISEHGEELGMVDKIEIVTNDFHMLRSWIMFSLKIQQKLQERPRAISDEDKELVSQMLHEGTPHEGVPFDVTQVRRTREVVMDMLKKYFVDSDIEVVPIVVEDVLETGTEAEQKYAELIRNNQWVIRTLTFEYQGIRDLLQGTYKQK